MRLVLERGHGLAAVVVAHDTGEHHHRSVFGAGDRGVHYRRVERLRRNPGQHLALAAGLLGPSRRADSVCCTRAPVSLMCSASCDLRQQMIEDRFEHGESVLHATGRPRQVHDDRAAREPGDPALRGPREG